MTMEEFVARTCTDFGAGVVRPRFEENIEYDIKGQFIKDPRDIPFSGGDYEDDIKHIRKVSGTITTSALRQVNLNRSDPVDRNRFDQESTSGRLKVLARRAISLLVASFDRIRRGREERDLGFEEIMCENLSGTFVYIGLKRGF
ncbi:hypothetical protein Tco_1098320 [Tanacetum coccineum]